MRTRIRGVALLLNGDAEAEGAGASTDAGAWVVPSTVAVRVWLGLRTSYSGAVPITEAAVGGAVCCRFCAGCPTSLGAETLPSFVPPYEPHDDK